MRDVRDRQSTAAIPNKAKKADRAKPPAGAADQSGLPAAQAGSDSAIFLTSKACRGLGDCASSTLGPRRVDIGLI